MKFQMDRNKIIDIKEIYPLSSERVLNTELKNATLRKVLTLQVVYFEVSIPSLQYSHYKVYKGIQLGQKLVEQ